MTILEQKSEGEIREWVEAFLQTSTDLSTKDLYKFYNEKSVVTFRNEPSITGLDDIVAFMNQNNPAFSSINQSLLSLDIMPSKDKLWMELKMTYVVAGDPKKEKFVVSGSAVLEVQDGVEGKGKGEGWKVKRFQVWVDASKVVERIMEVMMRGKGEGVGDVERGGELGRG